MMAAVAQFFFYLLTLVFLCLQPNFLVQSLDNGLALTPPMGWSTWNYYRRNFTDQVFYGAISAMKSNGMQAAGYEYINVDGGWWAGCDTGHIVRNATGFFEVDPVKYPNGIEPVIQAIHAAGFKYGHYTDAGVMACNKDAPMSEGYEKQDVALFVSWGIDMIKIDACYVEESSEVIMERWEQLINATGHKVLISDCHNGCTTSQYSDWCPVLENMWRTSPDINATWESVMYNLDSLKGRGTYGRPGAWNDPDFLEVDIGYFAFNGSESSLDENQAHITMWVISSSPLIYGFDFDEVEAEIMAMVVNPQAIAINQDYAGNAGDFLSNVSTSGIEVWYKPLSHGGAVALALFNRYGPASESISVPFAALPNKAAITRCDVTDVWAGSSPSTYSGSYNTTLRFHQAGLLILSNCQ